MNSTVSQFNYEKKFGLLMINVSVRKCYIQNRNSLLHASSLNLCQRNVKFSFKVSI